MVPPSALAAGEVHDPADRQQHVQDDHGHHQEPHYGGERTSPGVMARLTIEPRRCVEQHDKHRWHNHGAEGDQGVAGEEDEHLFVEEEPLGPGHVGHRGRVRRVRQGRRREVGERPHTATATNKGRILSERTDYLPLPASTRLYFLGGVQVTLLKRNRFFATVPLSSLSPLVVFVSRPYRVAMGGGISMPCAAAASMIVRASGRSSHAGGPPSWLSTSSPTSSKKRSYRPPGVWVTSIPPTPPP